MRRIWISLVVLALGAGAAVGQPAKSAKSAATLAADTDGAQAKLARDQRDRAALATKKAALAKRYEAELAAVDRLKQQRKSWRRERQLQDAQAKALDTSKELSALSTKIGGFDAAIAGDKHAVVIAIDAELPVLATGARKQALTASRAAAVPAAPAKVHKIVVPDAEIDPLADPEELDQQAQALRASEVELAKQVDALDDQTKRLLKAAELRKAHDRAGDLVIRDDESVRRNGAAGGARTSALDGNGDASHETDPSSPPPAEGPAPMGGDFGGFQAEETAVVLSEVIDPATGDALRRAGRGSDPTTKAAAAKRARDQVAARLEALRKKRAAVEARAKSLRQ